MLLKDFAQHVKRKDVAIPDICFILLDAVSITTDLVINSHAKSKEKEIGSLPKSERQKLHRIYTQDFAAYWSVPNLANSAKLIPAKVRECLHSKSSCSMFTQTTHEIKRKRAFARFKNKILCMDLVHVDKLANINNGVKYVLVHQDLFDRTVDAKGIKTKDSKETVKKFSKLVTKIENSKKLGRSGNRVCCRKQKILHSWRNRKILYNEWDKSCISKTYNTIPRKHFASLLEIYGCKCIHNLP